MKSEKLKEVRARLYEMHLIIEKLKRKENSDLYEEELAKAKEELDKIRLEYKQIKSEELKEGR